MKVGDKVRFLNDVGGGIIKGFKGKDVALVEDSDGFEIPVLMRECVVIDEGRELQSKQPAPSTATVEAIEVEDTVEEVVETKEGENISLYLAFTANDIKNLSNSDYSCYMVNDSNYYISFCYMTNTLDGWIAQYIDTIEPNYKLRLDTITKQDLNDIEQTCIQFFAYKKDKAFALKNAKTVEMRLDTVKFYKLHSFKDNVYFDQPAIIYSVVEKDKPVKEVEISTEEIRLAIASKDKPNLKRQPIAKKKRVGDVLEIDLHIHELLDNIAGLSNGDILEYQMKKFDETMNEYAKMRGQKIVFIHGKGNGVLKNAIAKSLKSNYPTAYSQDASFQEYGYGATMVTIK